MKKASVTLIKILLPILFLYNIGFFNLNFSKFFKDIGKTEPLNIEGQKRLANFINEKVRIAEEKKDKYSPNDYFSDLYEIEKLEKSLKGVIDCHYMVNRLLILSQENLRNNLFSYKDVDRARNIFKEKRDPDSINRESLALEIAKKTFWPKILSWLLSFYLKNLPLACLLFLIWWYKEKKNFKVNNPLSFLISLILYPIVIGLVIYETSKETGRYYLAEAELRRTKKKMFSLLSADELADLDRFTKSHGLTLKDWREYLKNQNLRPQRILLSSLVVTILFMAVPKFSFSKSLTDSQKNKFSLTIYKVSQEKPPNLLNVKGATTKTCLIYSV